MRTVEDELSWAGAAWVRSFELAEADLERYRQENNMIRPVPAQHQTDPRKLPGQVRNPIPQHMLAQDYKPTHEGYPDAPNSR